MPRNGSGVASAPAGTLGTPNTTIQSSKYNAFVNDIIQMLNDPLPVTAGGTGASSVAGAQAAFSVDNKVVYSTHGAGTYTGIATDNNSVQVFTGAATFALTAAATLGANWHCIVIADGADVTIDPNSSEQVNGATTLKVTSGAAAYLICTGSAFKAILFPARTSYTTKSANYTIVAADDRKTFQFTSSAAASFDPVANLGTDFSCEIWSEPGVTVRIRPDGSELINGAANLVISDGERATVWCNGTALIANVTSDALSGPQAQGYIFGLTLSNNVSDATNDVDIAVGAASSDDTTHTVMQSTTAFTKRLDATWSAGSGNGGRDTGSIADGTWHVFLIRRVDTGNTDFLMSLSATTPTMPSNYTQKRRIGSILRVSGSIVAFIQSGDTFLLSVPVQNANNQNPGTSAVLVTLTVPTDVMVEPIIMASITATNNATALLVTSPLQANTAASSINTFRSIPSVAAKQGGVVSGLLTTNGQIRTRVDNSDSTTFAQVVSFGWKDTRGKN